MIDTIWQDVRYAVRSLRRTPGFAVAAIVTLALGIGANTAIFSLIQAVILRTLPVTAPQELFFVARGAKDDLSTSSNFEWLERVRQRTDVFSGVTAYNHRDFKVASDAGPEQVFGEYVSGNYHAVLGVPMALGRGFTAEDDRLPGSSPIAVISDGYWSRRFGRSRDVLGRTLVVGGHRVSIVGVTVPGFVGLAPGDAVDITLPLSIRVQDDPEFLTWTDSRTGMPLVVRLKPGVTATTAAEALDATHREYMREPYHADFRRTPDGRPTAAFLLPAGRGTGDLRDEYESALAVLMGMVGLVLLIACVNIANLLLVRGAARAREVAIRASVGASRARLLAQFVTESLVLSLCGGALGVILAGWTTRFVSTMLRSGLEPVVIDAQPDMTVLLFATAVSLVSGIGFGLAPAFAATRVVLTPALKGDSVPSQGGGNWSSRPALVTAQVALCLVLVFGAGLLVRTVQNLRDVDGGFRKDGLLLFALDALDTSFPGERLASLCAEVITRISARPGGLSGGCSMMRPVDDYARRRAITVDGVPTRQGDPDAVYSNSIDAGYFATYGIELVGGRSFTPQDTATSPTVAVIGDTFTRQYFGTEDPVGRTFRWGRRDPGPPITIIGVVRDPRMRLRDSPPHMIYTPLSQLQFPPLVLLGAIRTAGPTAAFVGAVRDDVRALTRDVAVSQVRSMDDQIDAALVGERLLALLSSSFAALALLLACIGLYGVMSYDVSRRTREIGIRLALGASHRAVLLGVLRQVVTVAGLGLILGLLGASLASKSVAAFLFQVEPRDSVTLAAAAAVLGATAVLAGYFPARRASRVDPATALRMET